MRFSKSAGRLAWLVAAALLVIRAAAQDDTPKTEFTSGLNGTINLMAASRGIMDRSYPLAHLAQFSRLGDLNLRRDGFTIGELRAAFAPIYATLPPQAMIAYSEQIRFGPHRPIHVRGLLLSLNLAGMDFGYQHFDGELQGNGAGLSLSLDPITYDFAEYSIQLSREVKQFQATLSQLRDLDDSTQFTTLPPHVQSSIEQSYLKFRGAFSKAKDAYEDAAFSLRASLGYGYRSFRSGDLETVSVSASWLRPLRRIYQMDHRFDPTPCGLLFLASAQSLRLGTPGFPDRSLTRWGLVVAWQDRVQDFRPEKFARPDNRWQWQVGVEADFQTALEADHFYGAFLRHRPGKHHEYGLFGGLRDGRYLVFGLQAEWSRP